jgi:hypothetical protein
MRRELERRGMRVLQYVPDGGLMVASPAAPDLKGLDVISAAALEPFDKISPLLGEQVSGALLGTFHPDVSAASAREAVRARGFDVLENATLLPGHLVVAGALSDIEALAECDDVAYIMPASADLAAEFPGRLRGCVNRGRHGGRVCAVSRGWPKDSGGNVALRFFIRSLTG